MKQLLSVVCNTTKHTGYLDKALSKAVELGLVQHINPNMLRAPFKSQVLPKKINPKDIGVILSDGTISFQSEKQAIEFGKKKVLSGLHQKFPVEINVEIGKGGRVLGVSNGECDQVRTVFDLHPELADDAYISMHGHPELLPKYYNTGYTTAISTRDYEYFINSKIKKMIVYNSKGEYYEMVRDAKFKPKSSNVELTKTIEDDLKNLEVKGIMDDIVSGTCTRRDILNEAKWLEEKVYREFNDLLEKDGFNDWEGLEAKAKEFYEKSCAKLGIDTPDRGTNYYYMCADRASYLRHILEDDTDFYIARSHELWNRLSPKYGVVTKTNFRHFIG